MWSSFPVRAIFVQDLLPLQHHALSIAFKGQIKSTKYEEENDQ